MRYRTILASSLAALALIILGLAVVTQSPDLHVADFAGWLLLGTVVLALLLGPLVSAQLFVRGIEPRVTKWLDLDARAKKGGRVGAYIGAVGPLPAALFVAFVVGGNIGGAISGSVSQEFGPVVGVGAGIFLIVTCITLLGATIGFMIGGYATKRFQ